MVRNIIYISPGPTYDAHSSGYQSQYEELSKWFKGHIFTLSSKSETFAIGNFIFTSAKFDNSKIIRLKFGFFCIWNAVKLVAKREKVHLVISYDPLSSGIIGYLVSCVLWTNFATDVPGVYTSPAEWVDDATTLETKIKKYIYPLLMRFVLSRAKGIRVRFRGQIDPFKKTVNGKIILILHGFVQLGNFTNVKEDKEVLLVGFPFKRKGVDILIEAFKKLAPKYPDWKLKIMGWFPDPRELNMAMGGHPQIYHHPPVKPHEMPIHIGSCAIFALPSRSEALARVLLEAMSAGKPRVASRVDGIPTVINDGVDGLLVEPENVEDLAEKLDMLMSDADLRCRFGRAGEIRAREEFSSAQYVMKLANYYNEVSSK